MFSDEKKQQNQDIQSYSAIEKSNTVMFTDEHDVFGDKTVIINSMPGQTPGSSVLLLRLENSGSLLLTGDLYTHDKAREMGTVPVFNTDKLATLKSREKFEALVKKERARVVIQHSMLDFEKLPTFPEFLD